jgi:hypothetical protein
MALLAVPNSAFAAVTSQSSTVTGFPSNLAQDANTADSDSTMSQTTSQANAWWQADLGSVQKITQLKMWGRTGFPSTNFWVFLSTQPFNTSLAPSAQATAPGVVYSGQNAGQIWRPTTHTYLSGAGYNARYVMIQLNGTGSLTLAEVEIILGGGGDTTPPTVSVSPTSGTYTSAQTVTLTATASDNVGVTKVEFYKGGVLQSTDTSSPWTYGWAISSSNNGSNSWTAKAYDAANNTTTSSAASLTVNIPTGDTTPPTVSVSPTSGTYTTAQTVTLTATASDNVGVTKVEFYKGGVLQATDTASPWTYAWAITSSNNGSNSWTAKAFDAANNNTTSGAASLTVNISTGDTTPPTVSVSPTSGTYTTAQTVTLTATASDNAGVTRVEFFKGGVFQAQDTTSPYTYPWSITSSNNGSNSWTAKAFDTAGNNATSTAASLTVNIPADTTPPTVSVSPTSGTYTTAQTVTLTATASDNVGVTKVEFYKGGVLQATDTSSPWTYGWAISSSNNGSNSWTAKAFDAANNNTTSGAASLTVNISASARTMWQPNRVSTTYVSGCSSNPGALTDGFIIDSPPLCPTNGAITLTVAPTAAVNYVALMGYTGSAPTVSLYTGAGCTTLAGTKTPTWDNTGNGALEAKFVPAISGVCKVVVNTASGSNVSELAVYSTPWPAYGASNWPAVSSPNFPSLPSYASDLTVVGASPAGGIDSFMAAVLNQKHSELSEYLSRAHATLSNGFAAGTGYNPYVRDTATFIEEDLRHQPQQDQNAAKTMSWTTARNALIDFWEMQQSNGAVPDNSGGTANWTRTETDQESSLIRATYLYITLTNDYGFLNQSVASTYSGTATVQTRMLNALKYLMNNRIAPAYGLVYSATMVDWGDVELAIPFKTAFDGSSTPSISAYTNALFVRALDHYIELTGDTSWANVRDNIKQNMRAYLFDDVNNKWYPHRYTVKGPPVNRSVSAEEDPKFYHGGTTVAMQAGVAFPDEKETQITQMLTNAANATNPNGVLWNPTVGITVDVPYDDTWSGGALNNHGRNVYQNGGDWDWFGARTDQVMTSAGRPHDAWLQIDKAYQRQFDTVHNRYQGAGTTAFREVWEPHSSCDMNGPHDGYNWGCRSKDVIGWAGEMSKAIRMLQRQAQDYRDEKASKPSNTITASSSAISSRPGLALDENPSTEWVSAGACSAGWIKIQFPTAHNITGVVLHDRTSTTDRVNSGNIVLDGVDTIAVGQLPDNGDPQVFDVAASYPNNSTTSVQFNVSTCSGTAGLRDIEIFEDKNPVNIARSALTVTASTSYSSSYAPTNAIDGIYGIPDQGEWASNYEDHPWLTLTWDTPRTISRLAVYDRPSVNDTYSSFRLDFSDGSSIDSVDMYPTDSHFRYNNGAPRDVILPVAKPGITWVKFTGTGVTSSTNNGLSEFEVFENRNVAYDAMTSASSTSGTVSSYPAFATVDGFVDSDTEGAWVPTASDSTPTVTYKWPKGASKSVRSVEVWDLPSSANNINCARVTFNGSPTPSPAVFGTTSVASCTSNYCDIKGIPTNGHAPGKLYLNAAVNVTSVTVQPSPAGTSGCSAPTGNKGLAEVRILGY